MLPVISIIVSILLSRRALQRADKANEIACEALDIEKTRLEAEERTFVKPVRYERNGGQIVYEVLSQRPVDEVVFEFRNYAGEGGACHRHKLRAGEQSLVIGDFDEESDLKTPGPSEFVARVKWRREESSDLERSGLYLASKSNYTFVRKNHD